jgi:hypothetical protein
LWTAIIRTGPVEGLGIVVAAAKRRRLPREDGEWQLRTAIGIERVSDARRGKRSNARTRSESGLRSESTCYCGDVRLPFVDERAAVRILRDVA